MKKRFRHREAKQIKTARIQYQNKEAIKDQLVQAATAWTRETEREGIRFDELSDAEQRLYRIASLWMTIEPHGFKAQG